MVDFENFLKYIKSQSFYSGQIIHIEHIPARKAKYGTLEKPLHKRLEIWIEKNNIRFWSHQADAINAIRRGQNVVVSTSTASGKSLIYNLSVLDTLLNDEHTTALYIFPTKALARDQMIMLKSLMRETKIRENRVGLYDGDVDKEEKRRVLNNANIIITNPYGLHYYLPWFRRNWGRICKNLKYIILDEIHIYKGIFGSNFALLLRRLKRILKTYNIRPIWILSSATINKPKDFAERLTGEKFIAIDNDGSPSAPKKVILWDLIYDQTSNRYRSPHQETKRLFLSHLRKGIQTLTFTLSRKMAELQAIWARKEIPELYNKIMSYRAGISKAKRREIEQRFKNREILGISSTNALELGIDIGSLEATICSGFPGSLSSFWQQIGRSGRGNEISVSTLIPMENPLDLFYVHNPDILFGPIQEEVLISLKNKYILKNHLCCAANESPIKTEDYSIFGFDNEAELSEICLELEKDGFLMKRGKQFFWKGGFYPNERFNLQNLSNRTYKVILNENGRSRILATEDESYVFRDLHPGAVYLYEAETYLVDNLDLDKMEVYVSRADVDYYTQSLKHTDIIVKEILLNKTESQKMNFDVFFGNVKVEDEYFAYKVIDTYTQEVIARYPLEELPPIEFDTQAMWITIPFNLQKELELQNYDLGGSIHALEHAMIAISPVLSQISRWDLGGVSIEFDPVKQQPVIYIYDAYKGGIGIAESLYDKINELLTLTHLLIKTCSCKNDNGCPACIMSPKCGNNNEPLDKKGALFILENLINTEN
ncbi:MAG: DEAD/DEAH box helicase [Promethearchaeia archaeon]